MAQPVRCGPEKRARMRAFFNNGVEKMHVPWAVEGLPALLHLSLFLFFDGLVIFLFNTHHGVFISVAWWIGLFSTVYGLITLLPIIRHDSPYHSPLSTPACFLYARMHHLIFKILAFIASVFCSDGIQRRCIDLRDRYLVWMQGGLEMAVEDTVLKQSPEIDVRILDWTISALGDDNSLKSFFEAIPGFFNSKLVKRELFPEELLKKSRDALDAFLDRTWLSNSVEDSEKVRRLDICINAMNQIGVTHVGLILLNIFNKHWDEVPQTVEMGHTLARWCSSDNQLVARYAQAIIARILVTVRERNDSWVAPTARAFGLLEQDLRDHVTCGDDSVLLAILIHVTPQYLDSDDHHWVVLEALSKLDIRNTLPTLQYKFCALWNDVLRKARDQGPRSTPNNILKRIRHPYIVLHQGTACVPTAFSASTDDHDKILFKPWSYPLCNLASHRPASVPQIPATLSTRPGNPPNALSRSLDDGGGTTLQQANQTNIIAVTLPTRPGNPPDALSHSPNDGGGTTLQQANQTNNIAVTLPTQPGNPPAALSHSLNDGGGTILQQANQTNNIAVTLPTRPGNPPGALSHSPNDSGGTILQQADQTNNIAVTLPTRPSNPPDALSHSPNDGGGTSLQQANRTNNIAGLPAPSNPMTTSDI